KRYLCTAALLLMLLFLCAACHTKGSRGWNVLAALLGVLGAAVLLLYLCKQGRVLARVVDCVLLPCAALLFGVAMDSLSGLRRPVQAEAMADQAAKTAVSRGPLPLGKRFASFVACVRPPRHPFPATGSGAGGFRPSKPRFADCAHA
ncbi:MAG: hypothetical protein RR816_10765, partial [Clostridia bacterium]